MHKKSLEFIESIINGEEEVFKSGINESILTNRYNKNLFCVFDCRDAVRAYLINCCENKINL